MTTARDPLAGKLPVTLLTGFLGSGKTTLLSKLVRHPDMNRVAVVINEIGEIGIDHDIVTMASENVALLANGCICCSVRTDLQDTLRELFGQRRSGQMVQFDRVVIETTGLADPAPVVQTLSSDTMLATHYRLDGVVTLLDAVNGPGQIQSQPEAVKQIALADRVFVTKTDLAPPGALEALTATVADINPGARVSSLLHGEIDPHELMGLGLGSARAGAATLSFLGEPLQGEGSGGERTLAPRSALHDASIKTLSLRFAKPFTWTAFTSAMELLTSLRGPDLLRVKGIVNVDGKPVVVQGVQHVFHEPVELDRWPSDDTDTRLVFITRRIEAQTIRKLMDAVVEAAG
ncbi:MULTISPECIES: GTP-binding protein [Ramlibacter]|uniref:GTP-binding protein n=1 Tax=Ramlibacter pinisoli TaxID=2682844 RepID=A0A6N8IN43_9BURK|nr:GTP-binding protein [Ramlibacter sp. CGMCC 1.13660]MVQ28102.1 GTP-binding protein [Ramlibacter pinisoli]